LAGALALGMAACVFRAKQSAAGAAPPPPLSYPQTQVALPEPRPLNPYGLATDARAAGTGEPTALPAAAKPTGLEAPPSISAPPAGKTQRAASKQAPRKTPPDAAQTAPAEAAPAAPAEQRPPVQAIVSAQDQRRLRDSADARKREVRAVLARIKGQRMSASDQDLVKRIDFFLSQSDQAERNGDMSQADDFAQRAQALARGWQSGQ